MQAARRGDLDDTPGQYERNLLARCSSLPAPDRQDCERRMRGEGTVTGSVQGGGVYRELITVVPAPEEKATAGSSAGRPGSLKGQ